MTKPAPTMAAMTCAISRVRLGPAKAEQRDGDEHGNGRCQSRERREHQIGHEPVRAVMQITSTSINGAGEKAGEQQRGDGGDAGADGKDLNATRRGN